LGSPAVTNLKKNGKGTGNSWRTPGFLLLVPNSIPNQPKIIYGWLVRERVGRDGLTTLYSFGVRQLMSVAG